MPNRLCCRALPYHTIPYRCSPHQIQQQPVKKSSGGPDKEVCTPVKLPVGCTFDGNPTHGIWITKIKKGGNAEKTGMLSVGHRVLSIGSKDVVSGLPCEGDRAMRGAASIGCARVACGAWCVRVHVRVHVCVCVCE